MDVHHNTNEDLEEFLEDKNYDLVCLGYMGPRFKRGVQETCKTIRRVMNPDGWFVIGGYGPSSCTEYMLQQTGADVLVVGEGEETILEVMMAKRGQGITLDEIQSVVFMKDGEVVTNPRRRTIKYLNELPFPAWDLFPMDKYTTCLKFARMTETDRAFPLISTRGCTDKCSFCFRLDAGIRIRKPEEVVAEMKELYHSWGVNYFYFVDELSIVSKTQILKLLSLVKEELPPIKFRIDCRVSNFDDEIAVALKNTGCMFLNIGFETSCQVVLDQMNKRATVEQNVQAAETALRHGLGMGINMIWGMPGDSLETMRGNAEFIKRFNQYDQIRTIRPVTPYPGSPLFHQAVANSQLSGPEDFYAKFTDSDLYMVNFVGIPEDEIYETLFEVNQDLILDHFRNTSQDMEAAEDLIQRFHDLYFSGAMEFRGPRQLSSNRHVRADSATTQGVWDGMELKEGVRLSGM
jgi:anaerobic magnesium-protoporphyrin IX monomethyl ester cyclase